MSQHVKLYDSTVFRDNRISFKNGFCGVMRQQGRPLKITTDWAWRSQVPKIFWASIAHTP